MINGLNELLGKKVLPISKIESWLLKYSDLYKKTYDFVHSQYLFELDDGSIVRLPPLGNPTDQEIFLDLYEALDTISEFHRNEKYFEQEMVEYHKIKYSQLDLKNWVAKNEDLGANKYICFLVDYLDYSEDVKHLIVFVQSLEELDIYIDRQDFKQTIEFLEIFNDLFWVKKIYPESIQLLITEGINKWN